MVSQMKHKLTQKSLFQSLEDVAAQIPDYRSGNNTRYAIRDSIFIAFSTFFLQSKSFDNHLELLEKAQGKKNKALLGLGKIPSANQIRNLLDPIDPKHLGNAQ